MASPQSFAPSKPRGTSLQPQQRSASNTQQLSQPNVLSANSSINTVLRGGFMSTDYNSWKVPSFSLKYFVSSTFTDTHEERNVIMTRLLPELNDVARSHGVDITFVDMRWGIKDENTDDHKTWDACKVELQRCIDDSCATFFISLQGHKYGYRPLPREIDQKIFDDYVSKYSGNDRDELVQLAKKWYILDTNSVSPTYVLTKLDNNNRSYYWSHVLSKLLKLLTGLMFEENLYIGDSVTNWEAVYAAKDSTSNDRMFWMKREIANTITDADDPGKEFDDARGNADVTDRLHKLVDLMTNKLARASNHIHTTTIDSVLSIRNKPHNAAFTSYIDDFYKKMKSLLIAEVDHLIHGKHAWFNDANGSGLIGDECIDILHHYSFARGKVCDFEGRETLISLAMDIIKHQRQPTDVVSSNIGIQVTIIGKSGCGKTCLMAKLASLLYEPVGPPVIIRFCGTNDCSSSGIKLLKSIIRQIHFIYDVDGRTAIPEVYSELVKCFHALMAAYPVILLIDSIDQLSNGDQERSCISFLHGINVHRDGRIIVSCLPDDYDHRTKKGYWYGCDKTLKEWQVPRVVIKSIRNEVELILDSYLTKSGRCLVPAQRDVVLSSASQQLDPTVLFMKLAARVACSWKSSDNNCTIGNSVPVLIHQIFDEVQRSYGEVLIKAVIGFITLSVNGITSKEMEDLLSLDEEVMNEVNGKYMTQKDGKAASRVPIHVWLRVKHELTGLLVESDQGCMKWYHRQLLETASKRYSDEEKVYYHQIMGRYFSDLIDVSVIEGKNIYQQDLLTKSGILPVWFLASNAYINKRRCTEGGYHLILGKLYIEAIKELCNLEHVCAYVKSGNGFRLVTNLVLIDRNMSSDYKRELEEASKRAYHYLRWLMKDMNFILTNVEMKVVTTAVREPLVSRVKNDAMELLNDRRNALGNWADSFIRGSWIRERTMGTASNFNPLLMNLLGHSDCVNSVSLSSDGSRIVSGSKDDTIKVWDSITGEILHTLTGHSGAINSVSFNFDGSRIVSASRDNTIKVWDSVTGELLSTLTGHISSVNSVSCSTDGSRIISGSWDNTIKVWDSITGELLSTLTGHSYHVTSVSISADGNRIVSGSGDVTIRVWDSVTGEILHTLTGHSSYVLSVSFSFDGSRIVSASGDKSIKVWDSVTGELLHTINGHSLSVCSVSFSLDGSRIVSGSWDKTIKVWDSVTGEVIRTLIGHSGFVNSVSFNSDGNRIISGSWDNTIKVWDTLTGETFHTVTGKSSSVNSVSCSFDGSRIVSGSGDNTIRVWDSVTGEFLHALSGHSSNVTSVIVSFDGSRIVSGSGDNTIKVWDSISGEALHTLTGHSGYVLSVSLSSDASRIVSGSRDNTIKVWDCVTGEILHSITGHSGAIKSVSCSSDGSRIVSGSEDNTIKVWDCVTGGILYTLIGHRDWVKSVSFSTDGSRIVSGSRDNTIKVWDSITGELLSTLTGHSDCVISVSFSFDGNQIVSGSSDNTIKVWDSETGNILYTLTGHSFHVSSVVFTSDGSRIVSGSGDHTIKVWDSVTRELLYTLTGQSDHVLSVAFNFDGSRIVSGSKDDTIKVWDSETGDLLNTLTGHSHYVCSVLFSTDGSRIVSGSYDRTIKVWDSVTGEILHTLTGHSGFVYSVSCSFDGRRIVSGSSDNTIKAWDGLTGQLILTLTGHSGVVNSVSLSTDGKRIVSGSWDNTIKVWDSVTGEILHTLTGHSKYVTSVSFSSDGNRIISGSWDSTIKIWDSVTGETLSTLTGHRKYVWTAVFSSDGSRIISASDDSTVNVWDSVTGDILCTLTGHSDSVKSVSLSADGSRIVSGGSDSAIKIWDIVTGKIAIPRENAL